MEYKTFKVVIARSASKDISSRKRYILRHFKYREYAEDYSVRIKQAVSELDTVPTGYSKTGFFLQRLQYLFKTDRKRSDILYNRQYAADGLCPSCFARKYELEKSYYSLD